MFLPPRAIQNSSLSLSFYNLNITGDYRHLSFSLYSNASLPRLIQVIFYYSTIPHPGPSFPNPPELPTLIYFFPSRPKSIPFRTKVPSFKMSPNIIKKANQMTVNSGQAQMKILPCTQRNGGNGPAKLNLLPFFDICLLHITVSIRDWSLIDEEKRGLPTVSKRGQAQVNILLCILRNGGNGPAKLNLLPFLDTCMLHITPYATKMNCGYGPAKLNLLPLYEILNYLVDSLQAHTARMELHEFRSMSAFSEMASSRTKMLPLFAILNYLIDSFRAHITRKELHESYLMPSYSEISSFRIKVLPVVHGQSPLELKLPFLTKICTFCRAESIRICFTSMNQAALHFCFLNLFPLSLYQKNVNA